MKDPELRAVSSGARGLWIDMLSLMFESARRGYLQFNNGKVVSAENLARMTGNSTDDVSHWLQELDNSGVLSRTDDGTIYSRRQVRDEATRGETRQRVADYRERKRNTDVTQGVTPLSVTETVTENKELINQNKSQNQETGEEVFLVERFDRAPEGFDSSALAVGLISKLSMTSTRANVGVVSAAIDLASRELKLSLARATDWHLKQARGHIAEGSKVDRFYFEDGMRRWTASSKRISEGIGHAEPEPIGEPDPECKKCGGTGVWMHGAHKREVICHCRTMKVSVG